MQELISGTAASDQIITTIGPILLAGMVFGFVVAIFRM